MKLTFTIIVVLLLIASCEHEPIEPEQPQVNITDSAPCDSSKVYFKNDILPIFVSSCAFNGCHDASTATAGVVLTSYENIISSDVVRPERPDNSKLFERITETSLIKRMPPGNNPLPQADIDKIEQWILDGALNSSCDD